MKYLYLPENFIVRCATESETLKLRSSSIIKQTLSLPGFIYQRIVYEYVKGATKKTGNSYSRTDLGNSEGEDE